MPHCSSSNTLSTVIQGRIHFCSSHSSTSLVDYSNEMPLSQFECEFNKQIRSRDLSSQPASSSSLSSISQSGAFPQPSTPSVYFSTSIAPYYPPYSILLLPSETGLRTSDCLSLCHYLPSEILCNRINKFANASTVNHTANV